VASFSQTLEQHQGNVDTALPAYNTARCPDVEALLNINELVANKDYSLDPQVYAKRKKKREILHFSAIILGAS